MNPEDYKRFVVETFASREGLLNYVNELAAVRIKQFTVHIRSDGLWEVCHPLPTETVKGLRA